MKARKKEEKEAEYLRKKAEKKELKLAKRKARDPNMPKKPPSAYILFCNEQQTKLKAEQAHDSEEPLNQKEIMTKVGGMWSALPPEKKAIYQKRHDLEVLAHAKKMEAYNKSLAGAEEDSSSEEEEDKQPPVTFAMKKVPEPVSVVPEPAKAKAPEHEPHGVVDKRKKKRHESEESVMQDERHSADAARQEMTPSEQEKKKKKKKTKHPSDSAKE